MNYFQNRAYYEQATREIPIIHETSGTNFNRQGQESAAKVPPKHETGEREPVVVKKNSSGPNVDQQTQQPVFVAKPAALYPKDEEMKSSSRANSPARLTPAQTLEQLRRQLDELTARVEKFSGNKSDREYRLLEELLTQLLLKLDLVESEGVEKIKLDRRVLVKDVQAVLDQLELKAFANEQPLALVPASSALVPADANTNKPSEAGKSVADANKLNEAGESGADINKFSKADGSTARSEEGVKDLVLDSEMSC